MDMVVEKNKYCTFRDIVELSDSLLLAPTEPLFKVAGYQVVIAVQTESESPPLTTIDRQHPYFHPCMHAIGKQSPETRQGKERKGICEIFCYILSESLDFIKILSIVEQAVEYM